MQMFANSPGGRVAVLAALLLVAIASAAWHRQVLHSNYGNPDEEIARAVVTHVLASKKKDTNWARTDVAEMFRYNQFNFSSYYLAAAKIEKTAGHRTADIGDADALRANLREQNIVFGALGVLLAGLLAWRMSAPLAAIFAAFATATCVTLFQDSIYARPEPFVTVLTLLFVLILLGERLRVTVKLALSGLVLGVLLASKVTFAMYLPFPLLVAAAHAHAGASPHPHPWRVSGAVLVYLAFILVGFAAGAPYALYAPWEYLEGVGYLLRQYNSDDWHQGMHMSVSARFAHGAAYLLYTQGVLVPAFAVAAIVALIRSGRHAMIFAVAGPLLTLLYFLQTRTFFERNFSHALPVVFALAGYGFVLACNAIGAALARARWDSSLLRGAAAAVLAVLSILPVFSISRRLQAAMLDDKAEQRVADMQRKASGDGAVPVLFAHSDFAAIPRLRGNLCGHVLYKMLHFGDDVASQRLSNLANQGYRIEAELRGPFDGAPSSTLQSYHASNILFISSPQTEDADKCVAELISPTPDPSYVEVDAKITMTPSWTENGYPHDMSVRGWTHPFYASWNGSDNNTGDLSIGPFEACGDLIVPFAVGPVQTNLDLSIERSIGDRHEVIFQGPPPPTITWAAIRIHAADACASYTLHASDRGASWGQWMGMGMPVELQTSKSANSNRTTKGDADAARPAPRPDRRGAQKNASPRVAH